LKILISLEGAPAGFAEGAKPQNRRAFVASCVDTFLRGHFAPGINEPGIFDGFDIDWESPQQNDAADFLALVAEFRRQMDALRPGLRLSIAVGDAPQTLPGTDFAALSSLVDQVGIMNYDYTGPWSPTTGFIAPLYSNPEDPGHSNSIEQSIANYQAMGVPVKKMLMGLPFYGYSWNTVSDVNDGLFQSGKGVHGDKPYRYIRALAASSSVHRDARSQAPWLFDGQIFWTYEDPVSVRYKVSYAARQHLAGIMIWELSGDTADAELLRVAHRSLRRPMVISDVEEAATESLPASSTSPLN
jgi:chitinase